MDIDPAGLKVTYGSVPERFRNGDLSGYHIRYTRVNDGNTNMVQVKNTSLLEVNIIGLVAYTNYSVEVAAFDSHGNDGPFSNIMFSLSGQDSK